ncbi:MAG: hypothetical protein FJ098_10400, partial [Deltaproteobacteria bacterium]|nr:hypothetical protein [Deltaproteobacteria bacterium]
MGWRGRGARWVLVAGVVGLCACRPDGPGAGDAETPEDAASGADTAVDAADAVEPLEPSLFAEGCPVPGRATARLIESDLTRMDGPDAIGRTGDYLLMNEEAAFIIEAPERANAYYYYGGILVDAVAVEACRQAGPERFGELGIMMGVLKLDLVSSVLRAFRGTAAEVLSDGTDGGPAVVRVTGHDDRFWLVELELIRQAVSQGGAGSLSEPLGLDITVDYILESGSPVLRVEVTYRNLLDQTLHLLSGAEAQFGDTATPRYFAGSRLEMAGFGLEQDVPWMSTSQGDGAWAIALAGGTLATVNISGVTALVDGSSLESGSGLAPAGTPGDSRTVTFFVSVGPFDANSAVAPLQAVTPSPLPGVSWEAVPVEGAVLDEATGDPLAGAVVDLQAQDGEGEWQPLDSFVTRADGTFSG